LIKLNDILEVKIEKLTYGLEGLTRYGDNKFVIFIKNALPDEKLKIKIISINKHFARGEIIEILKTSEYRIKPICNIFNACGSCQAQYCNYDYLIKQKTLILKEIFQNIIFDIPEVVKSPIIKEYRHKIQYPCRQTKNSKRILMGYFKNKTHDLTNIKYCPLQPDIINQITQFIRDNYILSCYSEKTKKGLLKNVLYRISTNNEILITFVINDNKINNEFKLFIEKLKNEFLNIKGIFVNFNQNNTNKILSDNIKKIYGKDYIIEKLNDKQFKISANSFFQVNPKCAIELFNIVKENIKENSTILDAYGGVGAIGIYVSDKASKITLVEENLEATKLAKENFELNKIKNYEIYKGDAKKHFLNFKKENKLFDYIILDPPRSGCDREGLEAIINLSKNIIYVSCNPQTLKRDCEFLMTQGFSPQSLKGVDMFPYTYHIESVMVFKK